MSIYDLITTQFLICEEKKHENGEDSGVIAIGKNSGLACVADGCGGLGAMTYPDIAGKTGAYMASRSVANALLKWFSDYNVSREQISDINSLYRIIDQYMECCEEKAGPPAMKIKGSMVRTFPSTLAAIVYKAINTSNKPLFEVTNIWAGDSRTYLLTPRGLTQISSDDVKGEDALSNLSDDGILTNVISADKPYDLHSKSYQLEEPAVFFAATDGCFAYLSSPMRFEAIILEALMQAKCINDWKTNLKHAIGAVAGDDYTMALVALLYEDFFALQDAYRDRANEANRLSLAFEAADRNKKQKIWNDYKQIYYANKG